VLFEDALGETLDLQVLNNGSVQQFVGLGRRTVPFGSYTKVNVVFGRDVTVFPFGSQTGRQDVFAAQYNFGTAQSRVVTNLASPLVVDANTPNVVIDFRLRGWTESGNEVTPLIAAGSATNINAPQLHKEWTYEGTISGLSGTAPNQTFTLTNEDGQMFLVTTNSTTRLTNENGTAGAALANGQKVKARAIYTPSIGRFLASNVEIDDGIDDGANTETGGQPLSPDRVSGEFTLVIEEWDSSAGFPSQDAVTIVTTGTTKFQAANGSFISQSQAFDLLEGASTDAFVKVRGLYNRSNNRITAVEVEFESDAGLGDDAFVIGTVVSKNFAARQFVVRIDQAGGFTHNVGDNVTIQTNAQTEFSTIFGDPLTESQYYNAIQVGSDVFVEGSYASGVLTARFADVDTSGP